MAFTNAGSKKIDWKKISAIEIISFEQELNNHQWPIEDITSMIAFFSIDSEFNTKNVDPNFVKLFKLSQILNNFFFEKYLKYREIEKELTNKKDIIKENHKLRSLLELYTQVYANGTSIDNLLVQCPNCPKSFNDVYFLKQHVNKRHPNHGLESIEVLSLSKKIGKYNSDLMLNFYPVKEMKEELNNIKERLNEAQKELSIEREARKELKNSLKQEFFLKFKQVENILKKNETHINKAKEDIIEKYPFNESSFYKESKHWQTILKLNSQEFKNIGSRLDTLVEKLSSNQSSLPLTSISETTNEKSINDQLLMKEDLDQIEMNEVNLTKFPKKKYEFDYQDAVKKVEKILKRLDIKDDFNKVTEKKFQQVIKKINQFRFESKTMNQVLELKKLIKYDVKDAESKVTSNEKKEKKEQSKNEKKVENETIKKDDEKVVKSSLIKKNHKKKDKMKKPIKKLRFSENNIEISPSSSDDEYLNQLMKNLNLDKSNEQKKNEKSNQKINQEIDNLSSNANLNNHPCQNTDDYLKVSDLKWFGFLNDDEQVILKSVEGEEEDNKKNTNDVIDLKKMEQSVKVEEGKVRDFTEIVEKKLNSRSENLLKTKRLINVVDTLSNT